MIIAFDSVHLRDVCEDPNIAEQHLGGQRAKALRDRLADVRAAVTYGDLIVGRPRIGGEMGQQLRISLGSGSDLVLIANHTRLPITESGQVDWTQVSYVKVVEVDLQ